VPEETGVDKPLILILVKRSAIFLLAICAVSLFYWIVGSTTSFLDETQSMLLGIMRIASLGLIVASLFGVLLSLGLTIAGRHGLKVMGLLGYAAAASVGLATLAVAQTLSILSLGIR
jgi:hypothetical protein